MSLNVTVNLQKEGTVGKAIPYLVISVFTIIFNVIAFAIIKQSKSVFQQNGFREQLLIQCSIDTITGLSTHLISYWSYFEYNIRLYKMFGVVSGSLVIFSTLLSYGGVLGIAFQRFLTARNVEGQSASRSSTKTYIFTVGNAVSVAFASFLYWVVKGISSTGYGAGAVVAYVVVVVILTEILCLRSLQYLRKTFTKISNKDEINRKEKYCKIDTVAKVSQKQHSCMAIVSASVNDRNQRCAGNSTLFGSGKDSSGLARRHSRQTTNNFIVESEETRTGASSQSTSTCCTAQSRNVGHKTTEARLIRYQRDATFTVAMVVLALKLVTVPNAIVRIFGIVIPDLFTQEIASAISLSYTINPIINPFIYVCQMRGMRDQVVESLLRARTVVARLLR